MMMASRSTKGAKGRAADGKRKAKSRKAEKQRGASAGGPEAINLIEAQPTHWHLYMQMGLNPIQIIHTSLPAMHKLWAQVAQLGLKSMESINNSICCQNQGLTFPLEFRNL